jgi:hypothetical protein
MTLMTRRHAVLAGTVAASANVKWKKVILAAKLELQ